VERPIGGKAPIHPHEVDFAQLREHSLKSGSDLGRELSIKYLEMIRSDQFRLEGCREKRRLEILRVAGNMPLAFIYRWTLTLWTCQTDRDFSPGNEFLDQNRLIKSEKQGFRHR